MFSKSRTWKVLFYILGTTIVLLALWPLPNYAPAFSRVLYGDDESLLSATTSSEQQWCFPMDEKIPKNLEACIITYEDEYFRFHPGINPVSIIKSWRTNTKAGKIKRGASTIAMQVMRMKNKSKSRTLKNKIYESISAIKYKMIHKNETILRDWCEIAPFGGNTIGIKAASLRYFGRPISHLSWAEYALLAVMPNGPSSANLSLQREKLKTKRDFLLQKLHVNGFFDASELTLYLGEDLPKETKAIPQFAYHALMFLVSKYPNTYVFKSTINSEIQKNTYDLLANESSFLRQDDIRNLASVVIDIKSNTLVAYHGNAPNHASRFSYVDVAQAPRSYGSLLKPLLYAQAIETAQYLPKELVADIPTAIGEFQPENFDKMYRGAIPLDEMLIQSLNVPAVRVLNTMGLQSFYDLVSNLQIAYLDKGVDHYGLSIILGGGESSLWDLSRIYKGIARNYAGLPFPFDQIKVIKDQNIISNKNSFAFSPYTMDHTIRTMADLSRPREEKSWQLYGVENKVAWKTGTSYGHKDAWAMGFSGKYMVGVWVGNEGGEGRFGLTGISKAAPVMFKVFNTLPNNTWFAHLPQYTTGETISVCKESGKLAGPLCTSTEKTKVHITSYKLQNCSYHQEVSLNKEGKIVNSNCESIIFSKKTYFVLPPYIEYYYKQAHPSYTLLPEYDARCLSSGKSCKVVYPLDGLKIFLPKETTDKQNVLIAKAYHRNKDAQLYWFIDDIYIKTTNSTPHDCVLKILPGNHILTISDNSGNKDVVHFEIIGNEK